MSEARFRRIYSTNKDKTLQEIQKRTEEWNALIKPNESHGPDEFPLCSTLQVMASLGGTVTASTNC